MRGSVQCGVEASLIFGFRCGWRALVPEAATAASQLTPYLNVSEHDASNLGRVGIRNNNPLRSIPGLLLDLL